jgi:hypothetical protein
VPLRHVTERGRRHERRDVDWTGRNLSIAFLGWLLPNTYANMAIIPRCMLVICIAVGAVWYMAARFIRLRRDSVDTRLAYDSIPPE